METLPADEFIRRVDQVRASIKRLEDNIRGSCSRRLTRGEWTLEEAGRYADELVEKATRGDRLELSLLMAAEVRVPTFDLPPTPPSGASPPQQ